MTLDNITDYNNKFIGNPTPRAGGWFVEHGPDIYYANFGDIRVPDSWEHPSKGQNKENKLIGIHTPSSQHDRKLFSEDEMFEAAFKGDVSQEMLDQLVQENLNTAIRDYRRVKAKLQRANSPLIQESGSPLDTGARDILQEGGNSEQVYIQQLEGGISTTGLAGLGADAQARIDSTLAVASGKPPPLYEKTEAEEIAAGAAWEASLSVLRDTDKEVGFNVFNRMLTEQGTIIDTLHGTAAAFKELYGTPQTAEAAQSLVESSFIYIDVLEKKMKEETERIKSGSSLMFQTTEELNEAFQGILGSMKPEGMPLADNWREGIIDLREHTKNSVRKVIALKKHALSPEFQYQQHSMNLMGKLMGTEFENWGQYLATIEHVANNLDTTGVDPKYVKDVLTLYKTLEDNKKNFYEEITDSARIINQAQSIRDSINSPKDAPAPQLTRSVMSVFSPTGQEINDLKNGSPGAQKTRLMMLDAVVNIMAPNAVKMIPDITEDNDKLRAFLTNELVTQVLDPSTLQFNLSYLNKPGFGQVLLRTIIEGAERYPGEASTALLKRVGDYHKDSLLLMGSDNFNENEEAMERHSSSLYSLWALNREFKQGKTGLTYKTFTKDILDLNQNEAGALSLYLTMVDTELNFSGLGTGMDALGLREWQNKMYELYQNNAALDAIRNSVFDILTGNTQGLDMSGADNITQQGGLLTDLPVTLEEAQRIYDLEDGRKETWHTLLKNVSPYIRLVNDTEYIESYINEGVITRSENELRDIAKVYPEIVPLITLKDMLDNNPSNREVLSHLIMSRANEGRPFSSIELVNILSSTSLNMQQAYNEGYAVPIDNEFLKTIYTPRGEDVYTAASRTLSDLSTDTELSGGSAIIQPEGGAPPQSLRSFVEEKVFAEQMKNFYHLLKDEPEKMGDDSRATRGNVSLSFYDIRRFFNKTTPEGREAMKDYRFVEVILSGLMRRMEDDPELAGIWGISPGVLRGKRVTDYGVQLDKELIQKRINEIDKKLQRGTAGKGGTSSIKAIDRIFLTVESVKLKRLLKQETVQPESDIDLKVYRFPEEHKLVVLPGDDTLYLELDGGQGVKPGLLRLPFKVPTDRVELADTQEIYDKYKKYYINKFRIQSGPLMYHALRRPLY